MADAVNFKGVDDLYRISAMSCCWYFIISASLDKAVMKPENMGLMSQIKRWRQEGNIYGKIRFQNIQKSFMHKHPEAGFNIPMYSSWLRVALFLNKHAEDDTE